MTARADLRTRRWAITGALALTQTVSWGVLYYAFAVFLLPLRDALDATEAEVTGAFSLAVLVSAVAGVAVGRHLDRRSPRGLMTAASLLGAGAVVAWSQVGDLVGLYAVFAMIGVVMAGVLYEPAFVVLAKQFPDAGERRRAMTAMTLVAACSSFVFLPLAQALVDAYGWRDALLVLAAVLAAITVPLHGLVLRPAPPAAEPVGTDVGVPGGDGARGVLRSAPFWLLSGAFALASGAAFGAIVLAIPALVHRGYGTGFAAFVVGLVGISQIPGRALFAWLGDRLDATVLTAAMFVLMAGALALVAGSGRADAAVVAGLVGLGMANGMAILSRATMLADRYGAAAYGTIAGVAATSSTAARALAPVGAAGYASVVGYVAMLWTLAIVALLAAALAVLADRRFASAA